jgi:probable phosphoglycerate mutase
VDDPAGRRALSTSPIPEGLDATLVLVRHGESQLIVEGRFQGQADSPLSPAGREQATRVAARLADPGGSPALPIPAGPPRVIVHSPLGRAAQTAAAISTALGGTVPSRPDPGFTEIGQGEWEGLHRDDIRARFGAQLDAWRSRPAEAWAPGGESLAEVAARVRPALASVLGGLASATPTTPSEPVAGYAGARASGPWSVIVAHDGVFKVLMLTLFDLPLERFWMWSFDLCGLTVVDLRAGRPVLRAHNLTEHLAPVQDAAALAERRARETTGAL